MGNRETPGSDAEPSTVVLMMRTHDFIPCPYHKNNKEDNMIATIHTKGRLNYRVIEITPSRAEVVTALIRNGLARHYVKESLTAPDTRLVYIEAATDEAYRLILDTRETKTA